MEPPSGFWSSLWNFLCFLPYFFGLLLLGIIKGAIFCPVICLIMTIGNSAVILGLWPAHGFWTYCCIIRAKLLGPILKITLCISFPVILVLWPLVGITGSVLIGAGYGLLAPLIATFEAVGEGETKTDEFIHCIFDGTWSTVQGSFTAVRDLTDICFHSYFSVMNDLSRKNPPNGEIFEIRLVRLPCAIFVGMLGVVADMLVVTLVALYKSPTMLYKGWCRLLHDLVGREGPFLETACVPFAGLAILLWPLVVIGAVLASIISSFFLGAYAAVVVYQESSIPFGLAYIATSLSIYDEYCNDVLDLPEGSCFPSYPYRKTKLSSSGSISKRSSFRSEKSDVKAPPSRSVSFKLKPFELLDNLFVECKRQGENLLLEGPIKMKDIEECKSGKGDGGVLSTGLPAYCILQALLRSVKNNSDGLLLSDGKEITSANSPKEKYFDWFFEPLMIIKEQIKAVNLSDEENDYLCKLVLLAGDPERMNNWNIGVPPDSDRKRAEVEALARRLQGITKYISRFPTFKRRFDALVNNLSEELEKKIESKSINGGRSTSRSKSGLGRMLSQRSFLTRSKSKKHGSDEDTKVDVEIVSGLV